ncbi:DUF2169 family type VI secretion system accessory protein [Rhizobium mulingense]|uniref:DUF2169 family type VI secretion system accessory protein n=1 Tax=Rhizobium mulingense TaxID=3031128 RepID=UPI002B4A81B1|nr:DUF2169 domain-containing protein [Rhizobium sp. MJ21]MEB3047423.1 DUF2169 domain-containing protein [Rhizobium sp. MJ21]
MRIWNQTGYLTEFTMGMDKAGHEYIVVVVKGTFDFPDVAGGVAQKSPVQVPLVMADTYTGEPGYSATLWESDFAFRKTFCDVIANGCAYAPQGRPADRVTVGIKIGNWSKVFEVLGQREWRARGPTFVATAAELFLRQPFSYDTAWGGVDRLDPDEQTPASYKQNPYGTGWARTSNQRFIPGLRLPNTQAVNEEIRSPFGDYRPMSFGPYGRGCPGRIEFAGTYDQNWIDNIFPFLPSDFDERYFQMAPPDQQISYPEGGEQVILINLTPEGKTWFSLPDTALPMTIFRDNEIVLDKIIRPDTLLFDIESRRLSMVWRTEARIRKVITEFEEAWVGSPTATMRRAREEGKQYIRDVATQKEMVTDDEVSA